jgi:hypothetical protein
MYDNKVLQIKLFRICIETNILYLRYGKEPNSMFVNEDFKESAVVLNKVQSINPSTLRLQTRTKPTHTGRLPNTLT